MRHRLRTCPTGLIVLTLATITCVVILLASLLDTSATRPLAVTIDMRSRYLLGEEVTFFVHVTHEDKLIHAERIAAVVIRPDRTQATASLSAIETVAGPLHIGTYVPAKEGDHAILVSAIWRGAEGSALRVFTVGGIESEILVTVKSMYADIAHMHKDVHEIVRDLSTILVYVQVAVTLSSVSMALFVVLLFYKRKRDYGNAAKTRRKES